MLRVGCPLWLPSKRTSLFYCGSVFLVGLFLPVRLPLPVTGGVNVPLPVVPVCVCVCVYNSASSVVGNRNITVLAVGMPT